MPYIGETEMGNHKTFGIQGDAKDWEEAIRLCGKALIENRCVDQTFVEGCINREKEYPTGLPSAIPVAIPHFQSPGILQNSICVLRLNQPIVFYRMDSSDEYIETNLIFNLAIKDSENHLEFLQALMTFLMDEDKLRICIEQPMEEVLQLIKTTIA